MLRNRKPLPVGRALHIAIQMCRGLAEAHHHGVVHRDIKPANIMLIKNDEVRITDFVIAKVQSSATLTKEGSIVGTPSYMSPEQLSDQTVDGRSDIFAMGAVLYEMLTGHRAFQGENVTTVILKVVTQDPEPALAKNPELSAEITQVLAKALAKDPTIRYQKVEDLEGDLERLAAGVAPEAGPLPAASTSGAYNLPSSSGAYNATSQSGAVAAPAAAGSNRLPIVASAVGGIQDQIEDGVHGLLLKDPTDSDAFAAAVRRLLEDGDYAKQLGENARERVRDNFLGMRHLVQYTRLLEKADGRS